MRIDIFKKTVMVSLSLLFLNGCVEPIAFLGPTITAGTSGNIYQASLSYGANQVIKKTTGKTPTEHVVAFFDPQNDHQGDLKKILIEEVKETKSKIIIEVKETKSKIIIKEDDFFVMAKEVYEKNINNFEN